MKIPDGSEKKDEEIKEFSKNAWQKFKEDIESLIEKLSKEENADEELLNFNEILDVVSYHLEPGSKRGKIIEGCSICELKLENFPREVICEISNKVGNVYQALNIQEKDAFEFYCELNRLVAKRGVISAKENCIMTNHWVYIGLDGREHADPVGSEFYIGIIKEFIEVYNQKRKEFKKLDRENSYLAFKEYRKELDREIGEKIRVKWLKDAPMVFTEYKAKRTRAEKEAEEAKEEAEIAKKESAFRKQLSDNFQKEVKEKEEVYKKEVEERKKYQRSSKIFSLTSLVLTLWVGINYLRTGNEPDYRLMDYLSVKEKRVKTLEDELSEIKTAKDNLVIELENEKQLRRKDEEDYDAKLKEQEKIYADKEKGLKKDFEKERKRIIDSVKQEEKEHYEQIVLGDLEYKLKKAEEGKTQAEDKTKKLEIELTTIKKERDEDITDLESYRNKLEEEKARIKWLNDNSGKAIKYLTETKDLELLTKLLSQPIGFYDFNGNKLQENQLKNGVPKDGVDYIFINPVASKYKDIAVISIDRFVGDDMEKLYEGLRINKK